MPTLHNQTHIIEKNKPWILLIHGLFGNLDNLAALRRGFEQDFNVLSIDLPDHGKSMRTEEFSFTHYAQLIRDTILSLEIDQINIIGHSLGGKVAMQLALDYPDLVQRLVLLDIAPVEYRPRHESVFQGLENVPLKKISSRKMADGFLKKYVHELSTRQFLLKSLYQENDSWHWYFNLSLLKKDYAKLSTKIVSSHQYQGPTLFLKGELSDYLLLSHKDQIMSLFPHSQSKVVGGTGHWLHAEKPAICIKMIDLFFKSS